MCFSCQYLFSHIKLNKVEYTDINFNVFLFRINSNKTAMSSAQRQGHKLCKYFTIVKLVFFDNYPGTYYIRIVYIIHYTLYRIYNHFASPKPILILNLTNI